MAGEAGITDQLLLANLNRSIVDTSTKLADIATANHQSALNNHSRNSENLGKRTCELDNIEAMATSEAITRVSPVSQPHIQANGMNQLGASIQNNQNYINQGFTQLSQQIYSLNSRIDTIANK